MIAPSGVITSSDDRSNATPVVWWVWSGQTTTDILNFARHRIHAFDNVADLVPSLELQGLQSVGGPQT